MLKRGFLSFLRGRLLSEQICHRQLALDVIRIAARRKSIGGNHRDEYRFNGACFPDEGLPSVVDAVVLFFCNNVRGVGLLHRLDRR